MRSFSSSTSISVAAVASPDAAQATRVAPPADLWGGPPTPRAASSNALNPYGRTGRSTPTDSPRASKSLSGALDRRLSQFVMGNSDALSDRSPSVAPSQVWGAILDGAGTHTFSGSNALSRWTLRFADGATERDFVAKRALVVLPRLQLFLNVVIGFAIVLCVFVSDHPARLGFAVVALLVSIIGRRHLIKRGTTGIPLVYRTFAHGLTFFLAITRWLSDDPSPSWTVIIVYPILCFLLRPSFAESLGICTSLTVMFLAVSVLYLPLELVFLSNLPILYIAAAITLLTYVSERDERRLFVILFEMERQVAYLADERKKQDSLLYNVFPRDIARAIPESPDGETFTDTFPAATVLLLDIVGFTKMSADLDAATVVHILNTLFAEFDRLAERYSVLKIKTIGDAYLAVSGCPIPRPDSARNLTHWALDALDAVERVSAKTQQALSVRIGISTGQISAGIVGSTKRIYDVFGPAVDEAFALEGTGAPGQIVCCAAHRAAVGHEFVVVDADGGAYSIVTGTLSGHRPTLREVQMSDGAIRGAWDQLDAAQVSETARFILDKRIQARERKKADHSVIDPSDEDDVDEFSVAHDDSLGKWTLGFNDEELEARFRQYQAGHRVTHTILWILFFVIFVALWGFGDDYYEIDSEMLLLSHAVAVPLLAAACLFSLPAVRSRCGQVAAARTATALVYLAVLSLTARVFVFLTFAGDRFDEEPRYFVGTEHFTSLTALAFLPRGPMVGSFATLVVTSIVFMIGILVSFLPDGLFLTGYLGLFVVFFVVLSVVTRRESEKIERKRFAQSRLLENLQDQLEERIDMSQRLVLSVLPLSVYERLVESKTAFAERYPDATILFASIHRFSSLSRKLTAEQLVAVLGEVFESFEAMCESYQVEKVKVFDGTFMCVAGITEAVEGGPSGTDHLRRSIELGLAMLHHVKNVRIKALDGIPGVKPKITLRIGVQAGPLVAGVIGTTRFTFDCWGDVVNTASRMQSKGQAGKIQLPRDTFRRIEDMYDAETRTIDVKGKGSMDTALVESRRTTFVPGTLAPLS